MGGQGIPLQPATPLLEVENLSVTYEARSKVSGSGRGRSSLYALDHVDVEIPAGATTAVVGESGSGKSTLARAVVGLAPIALGSHMYFKGEQLSDLTLKERQRRVRKIQLVFQDPYSSFDPRRRLRFSLKEPLTTLPSPTRQVEHSARVEQLLERVGLAPESLRKFPHEFSGGQLQRLNIARALVADPQLLFLDEPLSALDASLQAQVVNLLSELRDAFSLTYVFITHDLTMVRRIADRVVVLYLGQVVEVADVASFFTLPAHPYSAALLSAIPIPDPAKERARRRILLPGDPPSPIDRPLGCRFHTRCWLRTRLGNPGACVTDEPSLEAVSSSTARRVRCHFHADVAQNAFQ